MHPCTKFQFLNHRLDGDSCKNFFYSYIFSFFLVLTHDIIIYIDFTRIAASNTATDDVTNYFTQLMKIDEKFSHTDNFNTI